MSPQSLGQQRVTKQQGECSGKTSQAFTAATDKVRDVISRRPGMALLVSATIGVLVACMIKRR